MSDSATTQLAAQPQQSAGRTQLPSWVPQGHAGDEIVIRQSELPEHVQYELKTIFSRANNALHTAIREQQIPAFMLVQLLGKFGFNAEHNVHRTLGGDIKYSNTSKSIYTVRNNLKQSQDNSVQIEGVGSSSTEEIPAAYSNSKKQKSKKQVAWSPDVDAAETAKKNEKLKAILQDLQKKQNPEMEGVEGRVAAITVEVMTAEPVQQDPIPPAATLPPPLDATSTTAGATITTTGDNTITPAPATEISGIDDIQNVEQTPYEVENANPYSEYLERSKRFTEFLINTKFLSHAAQASTASSEHVLDFETSDHPQRTTTVRQGEEFEDQAQVDHHPEIHAQDPTPSSEFSRIGNLSRGRDCSNVCASDRSASSSPTPITAGIYTSQATSFEIFTSPFTDTGATASTPILPELEGSPPPQAPVVPEQEERLAKMLGESVVQRTQTPEGSSDATNSSSSGGSGSTPAIINYTSVGISTADHDGLTFMVEKATQTSSSLPSSPLFPDIFIETEKKTMVDLLTGDFDIDNDLNNSALGEGLCDGSEGVKMNLLIDDE